MALFSSIRQWLTDRFGLGPIHDAALDRRVAKTPWYYGDGATLFMLLMIQLGTGAFMSLTYTPSPDGAFESVRYLTERQALGWFVRGLHYWSAGLMVVMVFFHMFRVILVGGYKFPREGTWLIGVMLFFGVLTMGFTGYVLRWDERAVYAVKVVLHMFAKVPLIGEWLVALVQGGRELGSLTLTRFYGVHVIFVPLLLLGLAGYHLYLVMLHGVTSPDERKQPVYTPDEQRELYHAQAESEEKGETFYPTTMAHSALFAMVVLGAGLLLTLMLGAPMPERGANLTRISMPREEWWYWWYSGMVAIVPGFAVPALIVLLPIVSLFVLVSLPFIDRGPYRGMRKRPVFVGLAVVTIGLLLFLTERRIESPWTGWPSDVVPPMPPDVSLTPELERGRELYVEYGCNSCHAVAGVGREVGPDLARIDSRLSLKELREYVGEPPEDVPMPAYRQRMTAQELELVAGFVLAVQAGAGENQ